MKLSRENLLAIVLLLAVLVANAAGLWPEISISRVDLNDNVFHYTLVERMVQAVERGENPLDCWSSEWSLGYPVLRTYQPLSHALVAAIYFALGKSVGLMTVFVWVRFLSVALLPLSFFAAARLMGFRPLAAAAAAMLAPLVSSAGLYGIEYGSYVWAGSGLFPQAVATHFLLITLGLAYRSIRRGRHLVVTGAVLGLTFLAHLIYGYMGALSVCLLAVLPDPEVPRGLRLRRVAIVGATAALLTAFQLVPMWLDRSHINHSRWEPAWKWDSFGAAQVTRWLFGGELLDHGRLPVLTLLALVGAGLFAWNRLRGRNSAARTPGDAGKVPGRARRAPSEASPAQAPVGHALACPETSSAASFVLCGAAFWTLLFFGRPFWGPALAMLGVSGDMQLHRVVAGAQIFLVLLAAIGLDALWRLPGRRWHYAAAIAATAALLYSPVRERARCLANNAEWGRNNLAAYAAEQPALDATLAAAGQRGGRVFPGLAAQWGGRFKIGDVPFYAFLSESHIPAVAFLYHSMALTADIMVRFNEWNPSHHQLFNIHTVVAPAGTNQPLPPFLAPLGQNGRFRLFAAPSSSYFDLVDVVAAVETTRNNFYDVNDRWLASDWVAKRVHLRLVWPGDVAPRIARISAEDNLPAMPALPPAGLVRSEQQNGEVYRADLEAHRPCFALFKMTWHANWKAYLDGTPQPTAMLSPGFLGVPLSAGRHSLVMRYQPESWKAALAFAGLAATLLLMATERRWAARAEALATRRTVAPAVRKRLAIAAGLVLLALPVMLPLFTHSVLAGHDAFEYSPRLVEMDQNVAHGVLAPRWAPDLGRGTGQPLFLFHPPMIYWLGELWHLLGFDFVAAMNLACATVVLVAAIGMFLLARLYFGDAGGWLGAAAFLYAPYFAVDLYVRSAMEEFSAFAFFALALYGFGAYARFRRPKYWLLGAATFSCVLACHFMAALLFTPLLLGFLGLTVWMEKSWRLLWKQAGGFLLGLGLSAFLWIPALAERDNADIRRAIEGFFRYSNHLVYLHQLFYSPWGYGTSVPGPNDGMSFSLGWSHLLLVAAVWIWVSRKPQAADRRVLRFFGVAAILLSVLMLQDALWFWEQVPLLQYVNLPWRLLAPVTICIAMLVAALGRLLWTIPRRRALWIAAAMALVILPNLSHLHPRQFVDVDLAFWTPQQLALRGFESTTMAEVTPRWMSGVPAYTPLAATVLAGDAEIERPGRTPLSWSSPVNARVASTIEIETAWFPGWEARVDGQPVPAGPGRPSGLITFQVPAGEHLVEVRYGRTGAEKAAAGISIAALLAAAVIGVASLVRHFRSSATGRRPAAA